MKTSIRPAVIVSFLALIVGACSGAAAPSGSASPGSPIPSPAPSAVTGPITTADQAAAAVIASDPRFKDVAKFDARMVGMCCFYQAAARPDGGFSVAIQIGWGDCPAGCINRHQWSYEVTREGRLTLTGETGPPLASGSGGAGTGVGGSLPAGPGIAGQAHAGPTCPVVRPGDSACGDRPVSGATILIRDAAGSVVAQLTTDANGHFQVVVPPGAYRIEPQPVEGLMGTAAAVQVTVGGTFQVVDIAYDTGIR